MTKQCVIKRHSSHSAQNVTYIDRVPLLTDWFARKNVDDRVIFVTIFITGTNQVRSITDRIVPLQSGSVFYEGAQLTGAQNKHRYLHWMVIIELYLH